MKFPERRQSVRIVTLRNFAWFILASLLAFAAISLRSELRGRHMHDYGRLVDHQIDATVARKPVEVIDESTSVPRTRSEPMEVISLDAPAPPPPAVSSASVAAVPGDSRVAIVGGPEGVKIVQQTARRPLLRGGFGR
jgi:hypothetical protein